MLVQIMNKLVVSIEFTSNHNRILRISLDSKLKKTTNTIMLSGDDMICYLLFPEVSFCCVDKWRKQDHVGVQTVLRYGHRVFSFLNHFPTLSMFFCFALFFGFFVFFFFFCFFLLGLCLKTVIGGRGI